MDAMKEFINEQTWNKVKDNVLAFSGLIFGIVVAIALIAIGWFIVWKMFLVRFPLIQELVYGCADGDKSKSKRSASQEGLQPRRSARLRQKNSTNDD